MFLDLSFVLALLTATIFYLVAQMVKNLPTMWETWVLSLGQKDPLKKEMATHSSILAWRIPWTEEPDRLQSMGCKESDTIEWLFNALLLDSPSLCPMLCSFGPLCLGQAPGIHLQSPFSSVSNPALPSLDQEAKLPEMLTDLPAVWLPAQVVLSPWKPASLNTSSSISSS